MRKKISSKGTILTPREMEFFLNKILGGKAPSVYKRLKRFLRREPTLEELDKLLEGTKIKLDLTKLKPKK